MRITSSTVAMTSTRSYQAETNETQTIVDRSYVGDKQTSIRTSHIHVKTKQVQLEGGASLHRSVEQGAPTLQESSRSAASEAAGPEAAQQSAPPAVTFPSNEDWLSKFDFHVEDSPQIQMLRRLLDLLDRVTGRKSNRSCLDLPSKLEQASNNASLSISAVSARYQQASLMFGGGIQLAPAGGEAVNGRWTRQVVQSGFVSGEEHTAFTSTGTAVTADGRTIDFGISVEMSRSFEAAYEIAGKEEVYTDPLVINLDTDAASLSDVSFYFDLDADGKAEEISGLDSASGFLALDKNGDGKINDGSELFGAKTGDGFAELAQYDQDGNGWIDENDEIFSQLSVWVQSGNGEGKLLSLAEADVGAIFLGSRSTQFTLTDTQGQEGAAVRKTGLYLKESTGLAGTVQHVDFKT